jgi:hypothetical protein
MPLEGVLFTVNRVGKFSREINLCIKQSIYCEMEFVTLGEAMIRYLQIQLLRSFILNRFAPLTERDENTASTVPSAAANFLRTVGGDELNVAVALSRLGVKSQWNSVLPTGYVISFSYLIIGLWETLLKIVDLQPE